MVLLPFQADGVLAQLVERLNGIEEVRGSNPLGSIFSYVRAGYADSGTALQQTQARHRRAVTCRAFFPERLGPFP
jgi:hypothetical protein